MNDSKYKPANLILNVLSTLVAMETTMLTSQYLIACSSRIQ